MDDTIDVFLVLEIFTHSQSVLSIHEYIVEMYGNAKYI